MESFSNHAFFPVGMDLAVPRATAHALEGKILMLLERCALHAVGI